MLENRLMTGSNIFYIIVKSFVEYYVILHLLIEERSSIKFK